MQNVTLLGATGSIGQSTLDVLSRHPDEYRVFALTAHRQLDALMAQAKVYQPRYVVIADESDYAKAKSLMSETGVNAELLAGPQALEFVSGHDEVHTVMAAIVGAAGLMPTMAAVKAGKRVLLANKESLVMSGKLFMDEVSRSGATLLPIDSEHNAIFQCLPADYRYGQPQASGIAKILLTGSGGPFLNTPKQTLASVTPDQACAHPNWSMGRKISVDSATMMNKGLEFIEACWLFGVAPAQIQVVIHPQSVIHSMVQYLDGSVLAQMGHPDMRTPIAHALAYPHRIDAGVAPLDFSQLLDFSFRLPDFEQYPNLKLAIDACAAGQYATTALNAANEIAVDAFLQGQLGFTQIAVINATVLEKIEPSELESLEAIIEYDGLARMLARQAIDKLRS
ncbi:1-deoxy-D-xylulose-5-phosphate reductoisomerase [Aliiglaciecola sp. CAU 1673]|uniref:1-deoxy-D-xylulose-5-phosphate reductoisomerase n=1 Tax=Aliiglaciecola sp. CAU 1673 TaxID=3032595 RepID=UPI0023DA23BE|nr:1-deoxy-D-xylulose-5-phosphate reductoisomerase [Aliiglaciecola sp. CAU 1673]MDF2179619.1 1-deoxy-D-xylulose-5-phosphate reductoisomerase [Aliiglaciecola sp. CAU 1673]